MHSPEINWQLSQISKLFLHIYQQSRFRWSRPVLQKLGLNQVRWSTEKLTSQTWPFCIVFSRCKSQHPDIPRSVLYSWKSKFPAGWRTSCEGVYTMWPIFHGPVIWPYILKTIEWLYIILRDYEPIWHNFWPQNKCSHCDLYFMVQWFFFINNNNISWRLFDVWISYFGIMSQYDTTFDLKINVVTVTYILWSSDFSLYLE